MGGRMTPRSGVEYEPPHSLPAEQAVIGGLLLDPTVFDRVAGVLQHADFHRPDYGAIFRAMEQLASTGRTCNLIAVSDYLKRQGLQDIAGIANLGELVRDTPGSANIRDYADIIVEKARLRRLKALVDQVAHSTKDGATAEQIVARLRATIEEVAAPPRQTVKLRHISEIVAERREPAWLDGLHKILERNVLAILAGSRGTFKSFLAVHWGMTAAIHQQPVLILSAEGAGLDRRVDAWMHRHAPALEVADLPILALERPLNLNTAETVAALITAIDGSRTIPALIIVDTFSKYAPGLDENDNAAVALFLSTLSVQLRERYTATVLLVAHAGHGDSKRPRGASVLMANPDAEYIVQRPDATAMTVTVSRERFKDAPSLAALAYTAETVDLGRKDRHGEPVTSLVMNDAQGPVPVPVQARLAGATQRQLLAALRANATAGGPAVWTIADIREIGRKAGIHKNSARSAAEVLTLSPYMTGTVGGWKLSDAQK
jgi:DnaB-like helicase N terminal domain/AAA domain